MRRLLLFAVLAIEATGCTEATGPRLTAVTPAAAPPGARVTITGEGLCDGDCATAAGKIQIGLDLPTTLASVIEYEDRRAVVELPTSTPVGATEILVTVNVHISNPIAFEVLGP